MKSSRVLRSQNNCSQYSLTTINVAFAKESALLSFGHFARIEAAGGKPNITGNRIFVNVGLSKANKDIVTALWDTGASVTAVSMETMRRARRVGALGVEIPDHGLTLTDASKQSMPIFGVFFLTMYIAGKRLIEPVVVLRRMQGEMILGQNVISTHSLSINPVSGSATVPPKAAVPNSWETALVQTAMQTTLRAGQSTFVKAVLHDPTTNKRLSPEQTFIAPIAGAPAVVQTDANGIAGFYFPNPTSQDIKLERGETISEAENFLSYVSDTSPTNSVSISSLMAVQGKPKPLPEDAMAPPPSHRKRRLIEEAVRQSGFRKELKPHLRAMLIRYADTISESEADIGHSDTVVLDIKLRDKEPVYTKQFTLPEVELQLIKQNVKDWLAAGIIEKTVSDYNSAVFTVAKKGTNRRRIVLDYRKLNFKAFPARYSIHTAEDLIGMIGRAKATIFSSIDLKSSFWQMELAENARAYTAFTIMGDAQYQWTRAAMGLAQSPGSFSRLIGITVRGLAHTCSYVDDLLTHSVTDLLHIKHLNDVFRRFRLHGLKINIEKSKFGVSKCNFLGYSLSKDGVTPGLDKSTAILESPEPDTRKKLSSFLGLANFYRNHIGHYSRKAAPLYALTRAQSEWKRGPLPTAAREAFLLIRKELGSRPLLAYPQQEGKFHLYIDGCLGGEKASGGLGAVLCQEQNGVQRPVGFASRQLQTHEANYTPFLIELTAAVFAINHFAVLLRPSAFTLHSDHAPMTKLTTVHTKTLNRLQQLMLDFQFDIEWIKGTDNLVADYLSRNAVGSLPSNPTAKEAVEAFMHGMAEIADGSGMPKAQAEDATLQKVRSAVSSGDNRELSERWKILFPQLIVKDDVLLIKLPPRRGFQDKQTWKIVCPEAMTKEVLAQAHSSLIGGHAGLFKTRERIREDFWWIGMDQDIEGFLKGCQTCARYTDKGKQPPIPVQEFPLPMAVNSRVHCDLHGPIVDRDGKKAFVVVLTDAMTKYCRLIAVDSKSAVDVAEAILTGWIFLFGIMSTLTTDLGKELNNELQKLIWQRLGIDHTTTTPYAPRCNGSAEKVNQTMDHYLRTVIADSKASRLDWRLYLAPLAFSYNTSAHRAIKISPHKAVFNYSPRTPLWPDMEVLLEKDYKAMPNANAADFLHTWATTQRETRNLVHANNEHDLELRQRAQDKYDSDKKARLPEFHAGQNVWLRELARKGPNPKLSPKWLKGEIVRRTSETTFQVKRLEAKRKRTVNVNAAHIKPRFDDDNTTEPSSGTPASEDDDDDNDDLEEKKEEEEDLDLLPPARGTRSATKRRTAAPPSRRKRPGVTDIGIIAMELAALIHRDRPRCFESALSNERLSLKSILRLYRDMLKVFQPPFLIGVYDDVQAGGQLQLQRLAEVLPPVPAEEEAVRRESTTSDTDTFGSAKSEPAWSADTTTDSEEPPSAADFGRRADRFRRNTLNSDKEPPFRMPEAAPMERPERFSPRRHVRPEVDTGELRRQAAAAGELLDDAHQELERLRPETEERAQRARLRLRRLLIDLRHGRPTALLDDCRRLHGQAPRELRALGTEAEVDYHVERLRVQYADVLGEEEALPQLAERLRSELRKESQTVTRKPKYLPRK